MTQRRHGSAGSAGLYNDTKHAMRGAKITTCSAPLEPVTANRMPCSPCAASSTPPANNHRALALAFDLTAAFECPGCTRNVFLWQPPVFGAGTVTLTLKINTRRPRPLCSPRRDATVSALEARPGDPGPVRLGQADDGKARELHWKPMSWLGILRHTTVDDAWAPAIWQTFFTSTLGLEVPVLSSAATRSL
jgi:hypothetical protein